MKNEAVKTDDLAEAFASIVGSGYVLTDEPMDRHTSMRVGGPADYFIVPGSAEELRKVLELSDKAEMPVFVMGNGSNLLVSDDGVRGAVVRIGKRMSGISVEGETVRAEAGILLSALAAAALEHELSGLEFAGGIPGSLGGACVMNAGAYGGEMKDVLKRVTCLDENHAVVTLEAEELCLGYRSSIFMKRPMVAVSAELELKRGNRDQMIAVMDDFRERRQSKQPLELPSAGSTFKRPVGYFAGKLIMDAGLSGYRIGGAKVSEKHCGFIVNDGDACAADVLALIRHVRKTVAEQFGVQLEPEVRLVGSFREEDSCGL